MFWTWQNLGKWKYFNHLVSLNLEQRICYSFIYFWNSAREDEVSASAPSSDNETVNKNAWGKQDAYYFNPEPNDEIQVQKHYKEKLKHDWTY